jgi:LPXTG-site transpeptidase (sortase) family protein
MKSRTCANLLIATGLILLLAAGVLATEPKAAPARPATATRKPTRPLAMVWPTITPATLEASATQSATLRTEPSLAMTVLPMPTILPTRVVEPMATRPVPSTATAADPPRLEIPKIGLIVGISEVIWRVVETNDGPLGVWDTVEMGVGHHHDSAQPGERGNVVISGHSRGQGSFAQLAELSPGDIVALVAENGQSYRYLVVEMITVAEVGASLAERRANAQYMLPTDDARLTLITCWPPWAYTHRLIVVARLEG